MGMRWAVPVGSIARDGRAVPALVRGGWPAVCGKALEARPRPDFNDAETKQFVYERETWQFLDEAMSECITVAGLRPDDDDEPAGVGTCEPSSPCHPSFGRRHLHTFVSREDLHQTLRCCSPRQSPHVIPDAV